jgi:hypothetical protein
MGEELRVVLGRRYARAMGYRVVIEDGPAAGWSYFTAIAPDEVIALAPSPSSMRGERWMRVRKVAGPWPGQRLYCRGPLPARDANELTVPDEVPISYRLVVRS